MASQPLGGLGARNSLFIHAIGQKLGAFCEAKYFNPAAVVAIFPQEPLPTNQRLAPTSPD